ncbi:MAG: competence protein ComJ [Cyanobacteriota bacterium]|nr:competence protein ComJ [Cyanobacteriota bacterium]
MLIQDFSLQPTHNSIVLYTSRASYGNSIGWNEETIRQGFFWSVKCFGFCIFEGGYHLQVKVYRDNKIPNLMPETKRGILVPFQIEQSQSLTITDLWNDVHILISEGKYGLLFELGTVLDSVDEAIDADAEYDQWCRLTFIPGEISEAQILRKDSEISPTYPLIMGLD